MSNCLIAVPTVPTFCLAVGTQIPEQYQGCSDCSDCSDSPHVRLGKKRISMRQIAEQMRSDGGEIPLSDSLSSRLNEPFGECDFPTSLESQVGTGRNSRNTSHYQRVAESPTVGTTVEEVGTGRNSQEEWTAGAAHLRSGPAIEGFSIRAWRQLLADVDYLAGPCAGAFVDHGWSTLDLFGTNPRAPSTGFQLAGLALMLRGFEVTEVTSQDAKVRAPSGSVLTYPRRNLLGSVPVWSIFAQMTEGSL